MRRACWRRILQCLPALLILFGIGCANNPFRVHKQNSALKRAYSSAQGSNAELRRRTRDLGDENQDLQRRISDQKDQYDQLEERRSMAYDRLGVDGQDGRSGGRDAYSSAYGGDSGGANGSLPVIDVRGAEVFRDRDAVRIRLSNEQLFSPGRATLKSSAKRTLSQVSSAIRNNYAGYLVGIEGHTDADPIRKSKWKHNHDLSVQRAIAVYDYLKQDGGLSSAQLFVAGFGPNQPIASNTTTGGKAQNRRVELAIYPNRTLGR